ncbi:LacI family DNA-binding transcriptional regulator [Telmatobacter bradus]|uniref:LacI family DNA-binding transcriptional regulator n=1 Tax=Telmatobacter bradus TaxID=474953 RepID=UPI003B428DEA
MKRSKNSSRSLSPASTPVRMKDIAHDLGISTVTVSKVLRDHPDIGEETRRRVLKRVKELNYQPNLAARTLITGRTWTIGLVVPDLLHPFFAQMAKSISASIRAHGYSLILASSEEDPELERQEIEQLLARRVDAILVASAQWSVQSFRHIEERHTPYILIDRSFTGLTANFVGADDVAIGELATTHLIEQGCNRIAHIRGPEISTAQGRLEGYRSALSARRLAPLRGHIVSIGNSADDRGEQGGYEATCKLLHSTPRPDGIFCFNDPIALGAMRAILEAGLKIPDDIAVVGCGNLLYSDFLRVPLTSVDQDNVQIGQLAARMTLDLLTEDSMHRPRVERVKPRLIVRASSQRLPH